MKSHFFFLDIIQISGCYDNTFGSPEGKKKKWMYTERQQAEVGWCFEMAQKIVLIAWTDASPSAHNQEDAAIFPAWRNQRDRSTAMAAFGLAHQQQQLSDRGHRPGLLGWLWLSTLAVLRRQCTVCTSFWPAGVSLSAFVDTLARGCAFGMEQVRLIGAMPVVSPFLSWSNVF